VRQVSDQWFAGETTAKLLTMTKSAQRYETPATESLRCLHGILLAIQRTPDSTVVKSDQKAPDQLCQQRQHQEAIDEHPLITLGHVAWDFRL